MQLSTVAKGGRIHLKKAEKSDYGDYLRWSKSRESIGEFQLFLPNVSDEIVITALDEILKDDKREMFMIQKNDSNKNVGWIDCILPERVPFVVQIGFTIGEVKERGNGFAQETVMLILGYLFSKQDTNRVQATTDVQNFASQKVLTRNGFKREGKLTGYYKTSEGFRDHSIFGITRSMWEKLRQVTV